MTEVISRFRLYLLGGFRLEDAGQPIRLPTRKVASLLAFLALHPQPHTREHLAALLWGDMPHAQATASLRTALSGLRTRLGPDALISDRHTVQLNPAFPLWMDVQALQPSARTEAVPAQGPGVGVDDPMVGELLPDLYDDWITPLREQYRRLYVDRLLGLTQELRAHSDYRQAIAAAQRVLASDAANEAAHQHLIFCYLASGDRAEALAQYERCRDILQRDYGVDPLPETTALYHWLRRAEVPAGRPAASPALPSNLPLPISSFVGRGTEVAEVVRQLSPESLDHQDPPNDERRTTKPAPPAADESPSHTLTHPHARTPHSTLHAARLVTLTGPGGCGKTRLAVQACLELLAARAFADGVWWVALASLSHEALVPQAVAQALGLRKAPARGLFESLVEHLRPRRVLLVLDNCEHLVAACAHLAERLLTACPALTVLTTSREPLGLTGEILLPVPPLGVPEAGAHSADALLALDAPRLFVDRARAVRSDLALTDANAAALASICRALDGIPLAIELAAAQARAFSFEQIATRLAQERPLRVLTSGSRTALPRHQTLRDTVAWSYNLLTAGEQALFRALSVFAGGWTLEAAQAVGEGPVAERLARLADKSLVVAELSADQARYRYLDTIREYALDRLEAADETEAVRRRHLDYFAGGAAEAAAAMYGPGELEALQRLDADVDNLRAALRAGQELPGAAGAALELATALLRYWTVRGHWREGREWLVRLMARVGNAPTRLRARALNAAAYLAWHQRDSVFARAAYQESLDIAAVVGADAAAERAHALRGLGLLAYSEGIHAEAWQSFDEALALFRQLGDLTGIGFALVGLGEVARTEGRYDEAAAYYTENLSLRRAQRSDLNAAVCLHNLGQVALVRGQPDQARALLAESLLLYHRFSRPQGMAEALAGLAAVESATGAHARAVRWFAASQGWMRAFGAVLDPSDQLVFDQRLAEARAQLAPEAFAAAWSEGAALAEAGGEPAALEALEASGHGP